MDSLADFLLRLTGLLNVEPGVLIMLADLLVKSALLVLLARYLELDASPFFSSAQKRLLWTITLFLLALLPVSVLVITLLSPESQSGGRMALLVLNVSAADPAPSDWQARTSQVWHTVLAGYSAILALHVMKLAMSFRQVARIRRGTDYRLPHHVEQLFGDLCSGAGVDTNIKLGTNPLVDSPVTFGILQPVIVLPDTSYFKDSGLLRNILVHELGHIKRYDTLTFAAGYFCASLNWFNPFVWYALGKLSLEAEFACDDEVLKSRDDRVGFATQLLEIARTGLRGEISSLANRAILSRGHLVSRIEHILHGEHGTNSSRTYSSAAPVIALAITFFLSSTGRVLAAGDESAYLSENLRLLQYQSPIYPPEALKRGLSGHSQYAFDVNESGRIVSETIELVRTTHPAIFDSASLQALESFQFTPRKVNGRSVPTSGVRFTFNYEIRF